MTSDPNLPPKKQNGRRKGPWSQAEIETLKSAYGLRPDSQIGRELNRSPESVSRMAHRVFSGDMREGPWSAKEVRKLKNYLGAASVETISQILRRPAHEIKRKVLELASLAQTHAWTPDDIQDLKRLYGTRDNSDLVMILGRPESDIEDKAKELCIHKDKGFTRRTTAGRTRTPMPRWSSEEVDYLRREYPINSNLEIAKELGRSVKSVVSKAHDLKLKKAPERLRTMGRENVDLRYNRDTTL